MARRPDRVADGPAGRLHPVRRRAPHQAAGRARLGRGMGVSAGRTSVRRPIPLRVTDQLGPMLCRLPAGYRLIVPAWLWQRLDPSERQAILRHELAHFTRGDLWKSLAIRALALPHWFNPFAWWAVRTFDECGEWACDDVATGPEPNRGGRLRTGLAPARGSEQPTSVVWFLSPRLVAGDPHATAAATATRFRTDEYPIDRHGGADRARGIPTGSSRVDGQVRPSRPARRRQDRPPWRSAPAGASARLGTLRFRPGESIERLAFAPDGKTLACWDSSGTLTVFEAATGKPIRRHHFPRCQAHVLAYLPGGKSLAVIGVSRRRRPPVGFRRWADSRAPAGRPRLPGRGQLVGDDRRDLRHVRRVTGRPAPRRRQLRLRRTRPDDPPLGPGHRETARSVETRAATSSDGPIPSSGSPSAPTAGRCSP